jgi:hypothetical protein
MVPSMQPGSVATVRRRILADGQAGGRAGWRAVVVGCLVAISSHQGTAQTLPSSREELMRKWDVDRDGKVDANEAEVARTRMRRDRTESFMNSGTDPLTGRPRVPTDPLTGRPLPPDAAATERGGLSASADEGGLILLPGTGEWPGGSGSGDAVRGPPPRSSQPERPALPGTRVPGMSSTIPSVSPGRSTEVPAGSRRQPPGPRDAQSMDAPPGRQPSPARPGVISGGVRAGGPGVRPGYGSGGPPTDLNAGRLPGGLPQTRGTAAGANGGRNGLTASQPDASRPATAGPSAARPGMATYRGPALPTTPSTGRPGLGDTRPGLQQPATGRPQPASPPRSPGMTPRAPGVTPRAPRMSTDDFYGR